MTTFFATTTSGQIAKRTSKNHTYTHCVEASEKAYAVPPMHTHDAIQRAAEFVVEYRAVDTDEKALAKARERCNTWQRNWHTSNGTTPINFPASQYQEWADAKVAELGSTGRARGRTASPDRLGRRARAGLVSRHVVRPLRLGREAVGPVGHRRPRRPNPRDPPHQVAATARGQSAPGKPQSERNSNDQRSHSHPVREPGRQALGREVLLHGAGLG